jgi:hypothetical protein
LKKVEILKMSDVKIGQQVYALIAQGLSNKAILSTILEKNPTCKTTMNCIYWYQNKARQLNLAKVVKVNNEDQLLEQMYQSKHNNEQPSLF